MKDRAMTQRSLLRRSLRRQLNREEEFAAELIQLALDDHAVFETLYESAMIRARRFGESTGELTVLTSMDREPIVDSLLKLLEWFVDNGSKIVSLIEQIVSTLGSLNIAQEAFEDELLFVV